MTTTAATAAPPDPAPHDPSRRLPALDVLRGIAILGTFLTNIWIFSTAGSSLASDGRLREFMNRLNAGEDPERLRIAAESVTDAAGGVADSLVSQVSVVIDTGLGLVTDGKFIGLLTIMFGIGLEIQRQAALRRGERWPGRYPWRALLLVLDGLLNYLFVFEYDVLMGYGLTALVVAAIMATSPRAQKIWMGIGLTAHLAYMATTLPWVSDRLPWNTPLDEAGPPSPDELAATETSLGALAQADGTYWSGVVARATNFWSGRAEIPVMFLMGLGLFLVGAHLYRAGIFEERGHRLRLWVMGLSFGVGLPIDWTARLFLADQTGSVTRYVTSSFVAFGVLALVAHVYVRRTRTGVVGTALSHVGRMALTCYILQNLLASIVFLPWGFGVSARIEGEWSTFWTLAIYLALSGVLVGFSALWLRRFPRGPVEWLWHRSFDGIGAALDHRRERRAAAPVGRP